MKTIKRITAAVICILMLVTALSGCGTASGEQPENKGKKLSVVTTVFPVYDWVREIVGDTGSAEISMLLDKGVDLHSFQPTVDDIYRISSCDMFVYVGGESDEWVEDALKQAANKDMIVVNLLDVLADSVKEEEVKEGMEAEEEEEEAEEAEPEYDEHVWLSLRNAEASCAYICDQLCRLDAANAEKYRSNTAAYTDALDALDREYTAAVDSAAVKTVVFGDRFPFRYLVDDYGLDYFAAFVGCSAESEASFETVVFLSKKVDELKLKAILQIESADGRIAETVRDNTAAKDQVILTMDSMQSTTGSQAADGATYLSAMKANLEVLKKALN